MSLPSQNPNAAPARAQVSIRSFFQPTQPKYDAPPSAARTPATQQSPSPPKVQQQKPSPPAPLPPSRSAAEETTKISTIPGSVLAPMPAKTHHPNITISTILPSHIPALRQLNGRLLQARYPDSFYSAISDPATAGAFSRVLLWTDEPSPSNLTPKPTVIGGLVCRPHSTFQARPQSAADVIPNALYVQSLALLEPYRKLGLAAALLNEISRLAGSDPLLPCRTICAHVWTGNPEGLAWYGARGFRKVEPVVEGYYRQLQPDRAWIVRREIGGGGTIIKALRAGGDGGMNTPPTSSTPPPSPPRDATAPPSARPGPNPMTGSNLSFQNARPGTEWNDLPIDMHVSRYNLSVSGSGVSSGASSRSSSTMRKKRDRSYPAAAFEKLHN